MVATSDSTPLLSYSSCSANRQPKRKITSEGTAISIFPRLTSSGPVFDMSLPLTLVDILPVPLYTNLIMEYNSLVLTTLKRARQSGFVLALFEGLFVLLWSVLAFSYFTRGKFVSTMVSLICILVQYMMRRFYVPIWFSPLSERAQVRSPCFNCCYHVFYVID